MLKVYFNSLTFIKFVRIEKDQHKQTFVCKDLTSFYQHLLNTNVCLVACIYIYIYTSAKGSELK